MGIRRFTLSALGILVLFSSAAFAQSSIYGLVQDQTGAVIPGAKVTITDVDTGTTRSAVTDAGGRYSVPSLIPDHYEIQAEMTGFASEVRRGIQLTIGSELEINMALRVGQASEKLEVTTEAPMVETLSGSISGLVNDQEIRDLPLNARTLDQLISLESSTPTFRNGNHSSQSGVELTYIAHGGRDQMNEFLLDGQQMIGAYGFGTEPGGALGYNEGVDAIREFQVLTSNPSAAFGKKAGAIVNMASRSGTNQIHGSAFEFLRNSDLDARNFYDHQIPPFRRNQFGMSVGGRIIKDRTFFFFSYEGLRQTLGLSVVETVPNNNARQGLIPVNGQLTNVGIIPSVVPFLGLFPLANGPDFGNGTAEAIFSPSKVSNQDFYLGRVDHRISDKDSIFVRYTASPAGTYTASPVIYSAGIVNSQIQMTTIQETRVISPTTVNIIRVGLARPTTFVDNPFTTPPPNISALDFIPGSPQPGQITFSASNTGVGAGGASLGSITNTPSGHNPTTYFVTEWTIGEELVRQQGPHSLHFGFDAQPYIQENQSNIQSLYGVMKFGNLTNFLLGKPSSFSGPSPNSVQDGTRSYRQSYMDAYVQDDYKVRRNLTLNLGVRWEFMSPPWEAYNRISNYAVQVVNGLQVMNSLPTVGSPIYASHYDNFAPRVGLAWDVFGDGKTAVRGGFGMFYDQEEALFKSGVTANAPFAEFVQISNPPFPFGFSSGSGTPPLPAPTADATNLKVATRIQYNLSVERQIRNTVFKIAYVGSEAYHLVTRGDVNEVVPTLLPGNIYFFPSNGARANPALSSTATYVSNATASYQGLDLSAMQRLSHGLQYKVNFTWAKNLDSGSDSVSGLALGNTNFVMENSQLGWERGLSAFDMRRNFVGNFTYDLPWVNSKNTAARWIGGWQVAAIVTIQDGFPFTALTGFNRSGNMEDTTSDRPNLAPGLTSVPIIGSPTRYFDTTVFALPPVGEYGNLGRNTLIGPGLANVDFNVTKIFPIGERVKLNFRAEFYNALNRPNFALPGNQIFSSSGAINPAAGVIQSTVTTSRQLQFGLKLVF